MAFLPTPETAFQCGLIASSNEAFCIQSPSARQSPVGLIILQANREHLQCCFQADLGRPRNDINHPDKSACRENAKSRVGFWGSGAVSFLNKQGASMTLLVHLSLGLHSSRKIISSISLSSIMEALLLFISNIVQTVYAAREKKLHETGRPKIHFVVWNKRVDKGRHLCYPN